MIKLILGDSLEQLKLLPPDSVHCVVTSPPYWGLRDYGIEGQMGSESTFMEFLVKQVALFAEVRRVLHPSGTVWLNMGDSYAGGGRGGGGSFMEERKDASWAGKASLNGWRSPQKPYKAKDLMGQPWQLAFALQDDGWYLRRDIIWHKPNCMPESAADRPTTAHEYLFLLTKKPNYFYNNDAIRERTGNESSPELYESASGTSFHNHENDLTAGMGQKKTEGFKSLTHPLGRNKRSVWSIPTEPCAEAHFATFPTALVVPCVKAGTSEKGCCPKCLAPWYPEKEKATQDRGSCRDDFRNNDAYLNGNKDNSAPKARKRADAPGAVVSPTSVFRTNKIQVSVITGWAPVCECSANESGEPFEPVPCTVMDIFSGSGTTGLVASRLGRNYIGIELNPTYLEISRKRIHEDAPLFNNVEVLMEKQLTIYDALDPVKV